MAETGVRVDPEDLLISGAVVAGHAMDLQETHALADSRIDAALPYLPGLAASALAVKSAEWRATTVALTESLTDHAVAFRTSAVGYLETDDANSQVLNSLAVDARA
jgi:uncharacterized protein YukE